MSDTVEQIKARLSIVDVVAPYVKLVRAAGNYKARCPFHSERTPSFTLSPDRGTYHCFGCNVGGDMFSFVQAIEGTDFKGALKILADKAGVPLVYGRSDKKDPTDKLYAALEEACLFSENLLTKTHPAYAYLEKRGLTEETIRSFRIGWVPNEWRALATHLRAKGFTDADIESAGLGKRTDKGLYDRFRSRIMFPLCDSAGRVVGFSGRIFAESGDVPADAPKYLNSPETPLYHKSKILYGFDRAKQHIRKLTFSILVEGQMDLVSVHQAGWKNAVAVSGTALTEDHINLLRRMADNVVLALDADKAGVEAARKSALIALAAGMDVKVALLPAGSDPADFILTEGKDAWRSRVRDAKHVVEFLLTALTTQHDEARAYAKAVRQVVLPFIAMIQSPIDRDHFVRMVAGRLGVGEDAVRAEVGGVPSREGTPPLATTASVVEKKRASSPRLRQIYGIVLWQGQAKDPVWDKERIASVLSESVGSGALDSLNTLDEAVKEKLRFEAEEQFAHVKDVAQAIESLFRLVRLDRLRRELSEVRVRLAEAEQTADGTLSDEMLALSTVLTNDIAKIERMR
ncbi:MAG: DNA primase [Patescibacteria group bacterium]